MRIAAIADVHGNSAALEAVLRDVDRVGADLVVNLGDHFSGPLDAAGTADLIAGRDMICVRGNHDRWLVERTRDEMGPSDRVAEARLTERDRRWLASLAPTATVDDVFACHGTPDGDTTYWLERVRADGSIGMAERETIERHGRDVRASLILCGHTHIPRTVRLGDGRLIVNPGSVGCPGYEDDAPVPHAMQSGTPDAAWALVERLEGGWSASLRAVPYDASAMVRLAEEADRPEWARALATGWIS